MYSEIAGLERKITIIIMKKKFRDKRKERIFINISKRLREVCVNFICGGVFI